MGENSECKINNSNINYKNISNTSYNDNKVLKKNKNNLLKKILIKIKDNFMCDDIKNEIKSELVDPLYVEIRNFILPHYLIFIILFLIIIILLLSIIFMISNIRN